MAVVSVMLVGVVVSPLTTARQIMRTSPSAPVLLGLVNATSGCSRPVRCHMTIDGNTIKLAKHSGTF